MCVVLYCLQGFGMLGISSWLLQDRIHYLENGLKLLKEKRPHLGYVDEFLMGTWRQWN